MSPIPAPARTGGRRVIVDAMISLDGFFAGPKGELDWFTMDEDSLEWSRAILRRAGTILFGRVTYEGMAAYWPRPEVMKEEPVIAGKLTSLPKVVFSRTLTRAAWQNTTIVSDPPSARVSQMKAEEGGDMVVLGSASIVSELLRTGNVDELKIRVQPVVLGAGRPLFIGQTSRHPLKLLGERTFTTGAIGLHYEVEH